VCASLTHALFPQYPTHYTKQEHHDDSWSLLKVTHNVHGLAITLCASVTALTSIKGYFLGWTVIVVVVIVSSVGIVWWLRIHGKLLYKTKEEGGTAE
jgi:hypothetical protein